MDIKVVEGDIAQMQADCIVVNLFSGATTPGGATAAVDRALDGAVAALVAGGDFNGEAGATALLYTNGKLPAQRVLVVGLGPADKLDLHAVRRAAAGAAKALKGLKGVRSAATVVHGAGAGGVDSAQAAQAVAEGALLAAYRAPQYKRTPPTFALESWSVVESDTGRLDAVRSGVEQGRVIAEAVRRARDLVSEPANVLSPEELAQRTRAMAAETGLQCSVLSEEEMRSLGMNILLAVSRGSVRPAQFIILEHTPPGAEEEAPLVLVGKGVCFDTGGISIKPWEDMWYMKDDMGGAAAVICAMEAIARLALPRRVVALAPCVENMPDADAFRPGDIYTGITGKSAEIISTDAEGRLILADALGYAGRYAPRAVVDIATLTGAARVALGTAASPLFANDDSLRDALMASAARTGERLWPFPLFDEYLEPIKSDMAEVKNSASRGGGLPTSAKFLEHFTEGYPWAHVDLGTTGWHRSDSTPLTPQGASGFGVRLLIDLAGSL